MRNFIVNVGHNTRSGTVLEYAKLESIFQNRGFEVENHYVTEATYEGNAEKTSVLRIKARTGQHDVKAFSFLAAALDQHCIAVAELGMATIDGATAATGKLYGSNPAGHVFDWALFRV